MEGGGMATVVHVCLPHALLSTLDLGSAVGGHVKRAAHSGAPSAPWPARLVGIVAGQSPLLFEFGGRQSIGGTVRR